jgi:hypothetical protein
MHACRQALTQRLLGADRLVKFASFLAQSSFVFGEHANEVVFAVGQTGHLGRHVGAVPLGDSRVPSSGTAAANLDDVSGHRSTAVRQWLVPRQTQMRRVDVRDSEIRWCTGQIYIQSIQTSTRQRKSINALQPMSYEIPYDIILTVLQRV